MTAMIREIYKRWHLRMQIRKTINELNLLSDRELEDLGLRRGEINYVACRSAIRRETHD